MYEVLQAGGFTNGGLNFDAKVRRGSFTFDDLAYGYILGMDTFALALIKAQALIDDGRLAAFVRDRYRSYDSGIGKDITMGRFTLEDLEAYTLSHKEPEMESGRQEYLESIVNQILFS